MNNFVVQGVKNNDPSSNPAWGGLTFIWWPHGMELDLLILARIGLVTLRAIPPIVRRGKKIHWKGEKP